MGAWRLIRFAFGGSRGGPPHSVRLRFAAWLVGVSAPVCCLGAPAWFNEMNRAFAELHYDGVFTYFTGQHLATLRIVHMVVDGEHQERLVHLNGPPREVIRRGDEVTQVLLPKDRFKELSGGLASGPLLRAFVHQLDRLSGYYAITSLGPGRIAGRPVQGIDLRAKDDDRFGHRLWLDQEHRLLLRSELLDQNGHRLEVFQFAQITIGDAVDPANLVPGQYQGAQATTRRLPSPRPAAAVRRSRSWRVGWMPAGFAMATAYMRRAPFADGRRSKAVNVMMYSDGLAAFSVFVEDMPASGAVVQVSKLGATVALRESVPGPSGRRVLVTLVGELPEATARRIARSVRYAPEAQ